MEKVSKEDYPKLLEVWEASVRATHDFLKEEDINYYKKQLPHYFDAVNLICMKDNSGQIFAFMGYAAEKIEMLFVHPENRGKGYGTLFIKEAIENKRLDKVDVNEQNIQAVEFYKKMGFKVVERSEKDGEGKDYPILHLSL